LGVGGGKVGYRDILSERERGREEHNGNIVNIMVRVIVFVDCIARNAGCLGTGGAALVGHPGSHLQIAR
jgi:hypothetical protein